MKTRLLATKLHIPPWRPNGVNRSRLLERLDAALQKHHKLILICAPAGYGKTTLVSEWLHSRTDVGQAAWLSLDEADNDLERFGRYWLAAFQQVDEMIGERIELLLDLPHFPPFQMVIDELLNTLAEHQMPVVMILDDYHLITNSQIHESLEYFLDHLPVHVHLVITTRQDPLLPLARLRARGQMTEIRVRDLRFSLEESQQFFAESMNLEMGEKDAAALEERTEGWPVGLQLAGLALQNRKDPQHFIETFRGSHRFVLDYLTEEVLRQQGEEVRAFLVQTSILERFNADSCRALTGDEDARAVLSHLEQDNLFVVSLDDEGIWYRYHKLFSDYLGTYLKSDERCALNKKAAAWHESNDMTMEAVQYAIASGDFDFAADVIERAVMKDSTWSGGDVNLLTGWMEALPVHALQQRPLLGLNASYIFYLSGRFEQSLKCIHLAEQALQDKPVTREREQWLALAALYRGVIAAVHGETSQAVELISGAQFRLDPEEHLAHARAFFSLGLAHEVAGQIDLAEQNYLKSGEEAQLAGVAYLAVHASCAAAQVQIQQAKLTKAEQTCQMAIELVRNEEVAPVGLAWSILGAIALERNDLDTAEEYLVEGIALSRKGGLIDDVIWGLSFLARVHTGQNKLDRAFSVYQEAAKIFQVIGVPRMSVIAAAFQARLQHLGGQHQAAEQWAVEYMTMRDTLKHEFADLTLIRILLTAGKLDAIPGILQQLLEAAQKTERKQTSMEVMLLLALYENAKHKVQAAQNWLEKTLAIAAPEGYTRIFMDEGKPLFDLLPAVQNAAPELVDLILGQGHTETEPFAQLPDPLSEQEIRVLKLIMAGNSNQEIADALFISVGTVKWHVHNIFQKMGVSSRSQAIALAVEWGL